MTRSSLNPLPGHVEGKAGDPKLVTLDPLVLPLEKRLFRGTQYQLVSYDNDFAINWRCWFDWKQWP